MFESRRAILSALFIASLAVVAHAADLSPDYYWRAGPGTARRWPPDIEAELARRSALERPTIKKGDRLPMTASSNDASEPGVTVRARDPRPLATASASRPAP